MMNEVEVKEAYDILQAVCNVPNDELTIAYKELRNLLERLCRSEMNNEHLQMTDLSARISWISTKLNLSKSEQHRLHTFRLTSNHVLNKREQPDREKLLRDVKTLTFFLKRISGADIPDELYQLLPKADATYIVAPRPKKKIERMRVCYLYKDDQYLYVNPTEEISEQRSEERRVGKEC